MFAFLAKPESQMTFSVPNFNFSDSKTIISPIKPNVSLSDDEGLPFEEPFDLSLFSLSMETSGFFVFIFSIFVIGS